MADDPLKPQRHDDPYVKRQKIEARDQLDDLLSALEVLGFTWTTRRRIYFLSCQHDGEFTFKLGRTLADRGSWSLAVIRAAHQRKCGTET